jgi:hypothetical protein
MVVPFVIGKARRGPGLSSIWNVPPRVLKIRGEKFQVIENRTNINFKNLN